jgi:hypothetical protein
MMLKLKNLKNIGKSTLSKLEKHHFDCSCFSDEHTFTFVIDPDDGELYLSVFLSQYGHWDTTILNRDDTVRLATLCQRAVEARDAVTASNPEAPTYEYKSSDDYHIPSMGIQPPAEKSELPPPLDLPGSVWHGARITAS